MKKLLISLSLASFALCPSAVMQSAWASNLTDEHIKRGELQFAARYAAEEGKFDQAEELLIKALSFCEQRNLPSQSILKLRMLLEICDQTGHYSKCSAAYRRSLALVRDFNSDARTLLSGLIDSLVEEGKYGDAIGAVDSITAKFKSSRYSNYVPLTADAEKAVLLYRMGKEAQADQLVKASANIGFTEARLRRYKRLALSMHKPGPGRSTIMQKISQEASLFPNVMALFELGNYWREKNQDGKAIDYWRQALVCANLEHPNRRFGNWSEEDAARRRAAVGLIELYERGKKTAEAVELCKYTIAKIPDSPGSRWSNVIVNEHLTSLLVSSKNSTDALKNLHQALSTIAAEEKIPSKSYAPNYSGVPGVREGNFDFQVKLCGAAKLFDQALALSKSLRGQNKLSDAQALMEHLVSVPGKEFASVNGGDDWVEELSRIYIAQKNFQGAKAKLISILTPVAPLVIPKNNDDVKRALAIINSSQVYRTAEEAQLQVPAMSEPVFRKYTTRLELLQKCNLATNDIMTAGKLYKQHALFLEMTLDNSSPRLAQRLDYVAERLSSQCHDPAAINYGRKAAEVARRVLENQDRFIMGLEIEKRPYDILQILKNYKRTLDLSGKKGESADLSVRISKYEEATKAGQMNGKKVALKTVP
ncbi:MAG: hypothetical protein K2Z81_03100, partial [Cyanobacteria bacterium]|nr:hypothetical protein [Cyanobacteriota bacterium]